MAKTKVLISCAVPAQLICVFVFAYANCWFSHAKAHLLLINCRMYRCICLFFTIITVDLKYEPCLEKKETVLRGIVVSIHCIKKSDCLHV